MKTYNAIDIAAWFLDRAANDAAAVKDITNMKLQKLVFFAQLVSVMTHEDAQLHSDDTHAWDYGPVVPKLYRVLKPFGGKALSFADDAVKGAFDQRHPKKIDDEETVSLLNSVWEKFKGWSAIQLSALTHRNGSPWSVVYSRTPYAIITPEIMRKHGFGDA